MIKQYILNVIILIFLMNILIKSLGIGDWGLGIGPNPQSPIPNPQLYYDY